MNYNLLIVPFNGFYGSEWDYMIENREQEEKDWLVENYGVDADFLNDNVQAEDGWNERCKEQIAQWYTEHYLELVNEFLHIEFEIKNVSIDSPRYYNYSTDRIFAEVKTKLSSKQLYRKLVTLMKENHDELCKIIKDNHTSCDGFWSWMSNDVNEWPDLLDDPHHPYLDYIIAYLLHIKARQAQWARHMDKYGFLNNAIYEAIAYNEYLERPKLVADRNYEDEWDEILEQIGTIENRRRIEATHPKLPGLEDY